MDPESIGKMILWFNYTELQLLTECQGLLQTEACLKLSLSIDNELDNT